MNVAYKARSTIHLISIALENRVAGMLFDPGPLGPGRRQCPRAAYNSNTKINAV